MAQEIQLPEQIRQASVTVIIPTLNEEDGIEKTIRSIPSDELAQMGCALEILVVDSGSRDCTVELARGAGAEVVHEPRLGYGRAYKTGFAHAKGDIIVTADADLTYPMEDIPKLLRMFEAENLEFITTDRYAYIEDGAMSRLHRLGNGVLNVATRFLFRIKLRDSQSGMWVFRKELIDGLVLRSDSMALSEEIKIEAADFLKCRWKEVPIRYRVRLGEAKIRSWKHGFGNLLYLFVKRVAR